MATTAATSPARHGAAPLHDEFLGELLVALQAAKAGDRARLSTRRSGLMGEVARAFNDLADTPTKLNRELARVSRAVGRDGRIGERVRIDQMAGH